MKGNMYESDQRLVVTDKEGFELLVLPRIRARTVKIGVILVIVMKVVVVEGEGLVDIVVVAVKKVLLEAQLTSRKMEWASDEMLQAEVNFGGSIVERERERENSEIIGRED